MSRWLRRGLPALGILLGIGLMTHGGWIQAKAMLAQFLLHNAWQQTQADGEPHRPWPWADHWPVARLVFPERNQSHVVLAGDQGNALAFAPGHSPRSGMPGEARTTVISGHRDTHFRLLKDVQAGEQIVINSTAGSFVYRVVERKVLDSRERGIPLHDADELVLVTCWPFSATAAGGPLRYVVVAHPVDAAGHDSVQGSRTR